MSDNTTVEIEISSVGDDTETVELSPGDEEEFRTSMAMFTVRALETEK